METSNSTGKIIGALIVGALAGAAIGVLFAPDKGSRTRRKILRNAQDMAEDFTDRVKEEAEALREKAMELEELAEDKLNEIAGNVKQKVSYSNNHHGNKE